MRKSDSESASGLDRVAIVRMLVLVAVVGVSIGTAGATAAQPVGDTATSDAIPANDATTVQQDESAQANDTAAQQNESDPVSVSVEEVARCGSRCRLVTANLTNVGNETLENVTAETEITTGDRDVWTQTDQFGNLSANASTNRTARIHLSYAEAFAVASNDGRITINTTVRWDGGNATFTERRRVIG
ncbi:hypothetical protein [Halosimplex amylolyticum]|uniref:hypothetical protein n=1 Tax=Halosimplex amylolyticum TaxID=3396616 RepID=UPI003F56E67A